MFNLWMSWENLCPNLNFTVKNKMRNSHKRGRGGFRVQKKVVTNFCKIDTIYIEVIALIFVVIVVVIIIIANVATLFCFEILVITA